MYGGARMEAREAGTIEKKAERTKGATPCTLRVQQARERAVLTKPSIDLERAKIFTEVFEKTEGESMVIRRAKAFKELCQRRTIFIQDGELIVGTPGSSIRVGMFCPDVSWSYLDEELDTISTREADPFSITEDQKRLFTEFIKPYWKGKSLYEAWLARIPEDIKQLSVRTSILDLEGKTQSGPGEFTPNLRWIISSGINGVRKTVEGRLASLDATIPEHFDKIVYLNALLIVCDGMIVLSRRYAQLAEKMAMEEKNQPRAAELEKIAKVCQQVLTNPARTFWEAVQSSWFYQICLHMELNAPSHNVGRLDQILYPYYKKDLEEGRLTKEEAQEILECLWVKYSEVCRLNSRWYAMFSAGYYPFQNVCVGGTTERGQDAVNELSYMMLQASMDVRLFQPSLSVRYNKGKNPDSFLHKVCELVELGTGFPAIHNDEVGIKMILGQGATLEEARDWNPGGCVEPGLAGKLSGWTDLLHLNMGSVVEFTLLNGINRLTGSRLPVPQISSPKNFKTFDEFKAAVKTQWAYLIRKSAEIDQIMVRIAQERRPLLVASLGHEDCIKNAKDYQWGGAKYNSGEGIIQVGIADLINSLMTVKKLIYDDKKLTWDELLTALDNDFVGYEQVQQMCLAVPKYGIDFPEVDEIATEMFQFQTEEIRNYRGATGGKMRSGLYPVASNTPLGKVVGALPSGRKAWQPLADGLSPMQGTDVNGPTAVLKSVSKINHELHTVGTLLNMKLDPSLLKDERGIRALMALLKSFCDLDIYHIQFNVVSAETLRAAQKEPEKYGDLLVRVAGYSAYFVTLSKDTQNEIISRTTQKVLV